MNVMSVIAVEPMSTRPCRFCLSLQHGSVFADFDVDDTQRVFLVRISFDGYGCCEAPPTIAKMRADESIALLAMIERRAIDGVVVDRILRAYFRDNAHVLWKDALEEHELV